MAIFHRVYLVKLLRWRKAKHGWLAPCGCHRHAAGRLAIRSDRSLLVGNLYEVFQFLVGIFCAVKSLEPLQCFYVIAAHFFVEFLEIR